MLADLPSFCYRDCFLFSLFKLSHNEHGGMRGGAVHIQESEKARNSSDYPASGMPPKQKKGTAQTLPGKFFPYLFFVCMKRISNQFLKPSLEAIIGKYHALVSEKGALDVQS